MRDSSSYRPGERVEILFRVEIDWPRRATPATLARLMGDGLRGRFPLADPTVTAVGLPLGRMVAPSNGVETSDEAAVLVSSGSRDDRHLSILEALHQEPLTDEDLVAQTGIPPNSLRPRRGELVDAGYVSPLRRDGKPVKALTRSGRRAMVWSITDVGIVRLQILRHTLTNTS